MHFSKIAACSKGDNLLSSKNVKTFQVEEEQEV